MHKLNYDNIYQKVCYIPAVGYFLPWHEDHATRKASALSILIRNRGNKDVSQKKKE